MISFDTKANQQSQMSPPQMSNIQINLATNPKDHVIRDQTKLLHFIEYEYYHVDLSISGRWEDVNMLLSGNTNLSAHCVIVMNTPSNVI